MPRLLASNEVERWERRLRAEGLAPVDQHICGRVIIRTEIITPRRQYLPDAARLAEAIGAWLEGDMGHFDAAGLAMLARPGRGPRGGARWPRRRARILHQVCIAVADGETILEAVAHVGCGVFVYDYLRPLYAALTKDFAQVDDDSDDDGIRGD